jgi:hypothetical protein
LEKKSISDLVFDPNSHPFDVPLTEWTAGWWKWLHSVPRDRSPASDPTGQLYDTSQHNPDVYFLAGTFGGSAIRKCTIGYGRAIFFPIITSIFSYVLDPHLKSEEELVRAVANDIDTVELLSLTVDEVDFPELNRFRVRSELFDDIIDGVETKTVSDGFWIFLKPFNIGNHTIHFMGKNIDFFNEVRYELIVSDH